jgi:microcystin-dependent protein
MSDSVVWADDVGQIQAFAVPANNPPKGWLYADGSAVSRAVYSELFKKIGTTFGSGDGSTTFNLPDLRGIFIRGAGSQTFNSQTYNGTFGTKQNDAFKSHSHSINDPGHQHAMLMYNAPVDFNAGGSVYRVPYTTDGLGNVSVSGWSGTGITINATGGSETHPANISLTYFIKYTRGVSPIISMAETVTGFATNSSGQSIPNASFTAVTNWTVVNDTHGIFDPTTGVLTVNKSGFIEIASSLVFNPNASGGRSSAIERNGSNLTINDYPTASGVTVSVPISLASYPVKAGDTFKIKAFQNSGGNLSLASSALYNYISWRIY